MGSQAIPLLTEIIPKYEEIYSPLTIETVYSNLRSRIDTLTRIVEASKQTSLITKADKETCEKGELPREIERRSQNNQATKKVLNDCNEAWKRLITGDAHICVDCGLKIDEERKRAVPAASRCKECQEKRALHIY